MAGAEARSAAFALVFRQGRSPPSCPAPDDALLLNRILDTAPDSSQKDCRDALIRVRRLSFDAAEIAGEYASGVYGTDDRAKDAAVADLKNRNPGFSDAEYRTAFSVGRMWAGLS